MFARRSIFFARVVVALLFLSRARARWTRRAGGAESRAGPARAPAFIASRPVRRAALPPSLHPSIYSFIPSLPLHSPFHPSLKPPSPFSSPSVLLQCQKKIFAVPTAFVFEGCALLVLCRRANCYCGRPTSRAWSGPACRISTPRFAGARAGPCPRLRGGGSARAQAQAAGVREFSCTPRDAGHVARTGPHAFQPGRALWGSADVCVLCACPSQVRARERGACTRFCVRAGTKAGEPVTGWTARNDGSERPGGTVTSRILGRVFGATPQSVLCVRCKVIRQRCWRLCLLNVASTPHRCAAVTLKGVTRRHACHVLSSCRVMKGRDAAMQVRRGEA